MGGTVSDDPLVRLLPKAGPGRAPSEERIAGAVAQVRGRRRARAVRVGGSLAALGVVLGVVVAVPRLSGTPAPPPVSITAAAPPAPPTTPSACPAPTLTAGGLAPRAVVRAGVASGPPRPVAVPITSLSPPAALKADSAKTAQAELAKADLAKRERAVEAVGKRLPSTGAGLSGPTYRSAPVRARDGTSTCATTPTPTPTTTPTTTPTR